MTVRRRYRRRRPLTEFDRRSPVHAFGVWLIKAALAGLLTLALYLFVLNVAVPQLIDGLSTR